MTDDRELVFRRIRESLKSAYLPAARASVPPRVPEPSADTEPMVASFRRELEAVGGKVYGPENSAGALELSIELLRGAGGNQILMWDDAELPLAGLGEAVRAAGFMRLDAMLPRYSRLRRLRLAELERAAVGLTGALAGLADTGSLALHSGPTRPRLASLLPPIHVALLPVTALVPTMAAFFAAYRGVVREGSNLVFVTGPSRSADIELMLTRGVHGPRELHVVLLG